MKNPTPYSPPGVSAEFDPRWASVKARDPRADGVFCYAVTTTGVYCRPSCAARRAKPEHVRFYATNREAEQAGYRPCKRCKPDQPSLVELQTALVTQACRLIEQSDELPRLEQLADRAGLSASHFHRLFKAVTGITPKQYAAAGRAALVRKTLDQRRTVTGALYDAGYSSSGRFYDRSNALLGMTPSCYRAGGAGAGIRFAVGECSLGSILVALSAKGICAILLGEDPEELIRQLEKRFPRADLIGGDAGFERVVSRVVGLVEEPAVGVELPLDIRGTAFQQRVWQALQRIPSGARVTYTDLARRIGVPKSVRAVARACSANVLAVAIPCHRVVRSNGTLSGYRWGIERKRALLERERRA